MTATDPDIRIDTRFILATVGTLADRRDFVVRQHMVMHSTVSRRFVLRELIYLPSGCSRYIAATDTEEDILRKARIIMRQDNNEL